MYLIGNVIIFEVENMNRKILNIWKRKASRSERKLKNESDKMYTNVGYSIE